MMDIHTVRAAEMFDVLMDRVTPEQRRLAKAHNFGKVYGITMPVVWVDEYTDAVTAKAAINSFKTFFPAIWMEPHETPILKHYFKEVRVHAGLLKPTTGRFRKR